MDVYAEERPGGYLRVMLRALDQKQTQAVRSNQAVRPSKDQITLPLLDNVSRFEWRFYDSATNRWESNWKQTRRPILAEMNLKHDDGYKSRSVFWLPPVVPNAAQGILPPQGGFPPGTHFDAAGNPILPNPNNPNPNPNPTPGSDSPLPSGGTILPQQ